MNGSPAIQQRMVEMRIQDLHAQAAHARLAKEARAARRARRASRTSSLVLAAKWFRAAPGRIGQLARSATVGYQRWYAKGQLTARPRAW